MKRIFYIQKYALWQQSKDEKVPDVSFVPSLMRRRLNTVEKIGLSLAHEVGPLPPRCRVVFASRFGEWQQTVDLIDQFLRDGEMSPAGFSHSVHNATAGLLSILDKNNMSYTSVAAGKETLESGLIEAFCSPKPVLFIYAEEATPDLYAPEFNPPIKGHGLAFIITSTPTKGALPIQTESNDCSNKTIFFRQCVAFLKEKKPLLMKGLTVKK